MVVVTNTERSAASHTQQTVPFEEAMERGSSAWVQAQRQKPLEDPIAEADRQKDLLRAQESQITSELTLLRPYLADFLIMEPLTQKLNTWFAIGNDDYPITESMIINDLEYPDDSARSALLAKYKAVAADYQALLKVHVQNRIDGKISQNEYMETMPPSINRMLNLKTGNNWTKALWLVGKTCSFSYFDFKNPFSRRAIEKIGAEELMKIRFKEFEFMNRLLPEPNLLQQYVSGFLGGKIYGKVAERVFELKAQIAAKKAAAKGQAEPPPYALITDDEVMTMLGLAHLTDLLVGMYLGPDREKAKLDKSNRTSTVQYVQNSLTLPLKIDGRLSVEEEKLILFLGQHGYQTYKESIGAQTKYAL